MSLVFVGGATGYTGREVVKQLCARGIPTVAHVRPDSSRVGEFSAIFEGMGAQVDVTPWQPECHPRDLPASQALLRICVVGDHTRPWQKGQLRCCGGYLRSGRSGLNPSALGCSSGCAACAAFCVSFFAGGRSSWWKRLFAGPCQGGAAPDPGNRSIYHRAAFIYHRRRSRRSASS